MKFKLVEDWDRLEEARKQTQAQKFLEIIFYIYLAEEDTTDPNWRLSSALIRTNAQSGGDNNKSNIQKVSNKRLMKIIQDSGLYDVWLTDPKTNSFEIKLK